MVEGKSAPGEGKGPSASMGGWSSGCVFLAPATRDFSKAIGPSNKLEHFDLSPNALVRNHKDPKVQLKEPLRRVRIRRTIKSLETESYPGLSI